MKTIKTLTCLLIAVLTGALLISCAGQEPGYAEDVSPEQIELKESEKPPLAQETPDIENDSTDENDDAIDTDDEDAVDTANEDEAAANTADEDEIDESEDGIFESVQWLTYHMNIEVTEAAPSGTDIIPEGKFVHVILTYISDENELGGFLYDDLSDTANFLLMDASGNVYEHLSVFNPLRVNIKNDKLSIAEIQPVLGVYFDIPIDVQLNEITFNITG